jgi:hypothetical protein
VVREQTVKAVLTIVNKLNDRIVNGELLKFLARTANDEQPGIRTNTTICLGRIAKNLSQSVGDLSLILEHAADITCRLALRCLLRHSRDLSETHLSTLETQDFWLCLRLSMYLARKIVLLGSCLPFALHFWTRKSE